MKEKLNYNGFTFEYTVYKEIDKNAKRKLSVKARSIEKYAEGLHYVILNEEYNTTKGQKYKSLNYYITAIKNKITELEDELKKYEKEIE